MEMRRLPTDKFGSVYYGPKTYKEAKARAEQMLREGWNCIPGLVGMLKQAGYTGVANRIQKEFGDK